MLDVDCSYAWFMILEVLKLSLESRLEIEYLMDACI